MEFHPASNLELQPSDDDAFELVIFGSKDTIVSEALNHNYPGVKEWRTKDLFKPHPTKKGLWRFHSRRDDIIVLSNGEKLNPVPLESQLQSLPEVSGALVTGEGRQQPSLLLEVRRKEGQSDASLIEVLWPAIELANKEMPRYGQITRSMIQLASPEKPFARASKGTAVRKLTERLYAAEIEDLYSGTARKAPTKALTLLPTAFTAMAVKELVRAILPSSLDAKRLKDADDLYVAGLDSLMTIETVRALKSTLAAHRSASQLTWLNTGTIYRNPSIDQLTELLLSFLNDGILTEQKSRIAEISDTIEQYARLLPNGVTPRNSSRTAETLVLAITGTTGALGSYMLDRLSYHPKITKIFCLNRSATAERQWHERKSSQQTANHCSPKAETSFLTINFALPNFGLSTPEWTDLTISTDLILHNAWKVDFNQNLSSFAENVQSVITMTQWSHFSPRQPRLVFVSSIAAVGPWNPSFLSTDGLSMEEINSQGKYEGIPETFLPDHLAHSMENGYGESKAVTEHLLHRFSTQTQVPVTVIRAGLMGAPAASAPDHRDTVGKVGRGPDRDIAPAIFRTCKSVRMIPQELLDVDWIAMDTVADIISEICLYEASSSPTTKAESMTEFSVIPADLVKYYHVINPHPKPWSEFIPLLQKHLGNSGATVVPLAEWVEMLQSVDLAANPESVEEMPALRMLGMFELLLKNGTKFARYRTEKAQSASATLQGLKAVENELMEKWIGEALDGK